MYIIQVQSIFNRCTSHEKHVVITSLNNLFQPIQTLPTLSTSLLIV